MRDSKRDTDVKNRLLDSPLRQALAQDLASPSDRALGQGCAFPLRQALGQGCASPLTQGSGAGLRLPPQMGNTCTLIADSCECMAKSTTIL